MKPLELRVACREPVPCVIREREEKKTRKQKEEKDAYIKKDREREKKMEKSFEERDTKRHVISVGGKRERRSNLCNKRGSTRRGRTTVSSTASAPRIPVCVAIPEEPRGRRVASWRRAIVNPGSRFVSVPPTRTLPPLPSHRSCYVPGQVRGPVPPGQPAIISSLFLWLPLVSTLVKE